jgi:beta-lactamase regulating signal transducer with metallopeptidase domain
MEALVEIGLGNACIALALAVVAWGVERVFKRSDLAYWLWLLVLVKLVTFPVFTVPVESIPGLAAPSSYWGAGPYEVEALAPTADFYRLGWREFWQYGKTGLALLWLPGSLLVLVWSLARIYRFNRLLEIESCPASPDLQADAEKIAAGLGLKAVPIIYTTSAALAPMVWWAGGRVRIVVPDVLLERMAAAQLHWVLAHELAHVRRRDYMVRWLEWLGSVFFWWNPVVWLARYHLRANEEICCDRLVLSKLRPRPKLYAHSLLNAVECLASPVVPMPAMASQVNSYGFLERRFRMIIAKTPHRGSPRWARACALLLALAVLPLGLGSAFAEDRDVGLAKAPESEKTTDDTPDRARLVKADRRAEEAEKSVLVDLDGNGKISDWEQAESKAWAHDEYRERRREIDANGDGKISPAEVALYAELRAKRQADTDGDGVLSDDEKSVAAERLARAEMQRRYAERQWQGEYDTDGDGKLSAIERLVAAAKERHKRDKPGPAKSEYVKPEYAKQVHDKEQ